MKKKNIIVILGIVVVVIIFIVLVVSRINEPFLSTSFDANVKIVMVLENDEVKTSTINIESDGQNAIVEVSNLTNDIYIYEDEMYYLSGGRYKKIKTENNFIDIYRKISELDIGKSISEVNGEKIYNPILSVNESNELLSILHTKMSTNRTMNGHISIKNNRLNYFNVTYEDIEGYKSVSISINFKEYEGECNIPKIYDDLVDEVDEDVIDINA